MTVPGCQSCNQEKDRYDLYLRDVLGLSIELHDVPELKFLRDQTVKSALKVDTVRPARAMLLTYKRVYGVSKSGDYGVVALSVEADGDKMRTAFQWILRGIWYFHNKTVLNIEDFECVPYWGKDLSLGMSHLWPDFGEATTLPVGNSVRYRPVFCIEPAGGSCLILLNGRLLFNVLFNVQALESAFLQKQVPIDD